jgi:hypothetical protein
MADHLDRWARLMAASLTRRRFLAKLGGVGAGLAAMFAAQGTKPAGASRGRPPGFPHTIVNDIVLPPSRVAVNGGIPPIIISDVFVPPSDGHNRGFFPPSIRLNERGFTLPLGPDEQFGVNEKWFPPGR